MPPYTTDDKEIKRLYNWISTQKDNYKTNQYLMKNKEIKKLWEKFINDQTYKKYFISNENEWFKLLLFSRLKGK
jgi:hypothetical protein